MKSRVRVFFLLLAALVLSPTAFAQNTSWTDWVSHVPGSSTGVAAGTVLDGQVAVTYTGEVLANTQTSDNIGTNYWVGGMTPPGTSPYTSATVTNAPGTAEIITLQGGPGSGTNTITFSQAVLDPVMAVVSLGQGGVPVRYSFDQDFNVLSSGIGFWGGGTFANDGNDLLLGEEGHGTIQFSGWVSSISWVASPSEFWHGFQIGVIPEPETYALMLAGLGLLGFVATRRRRAILAAA